MRPVMLPTEMVTATDGTGGGFDYMQRRRQHTRLISEMTVYNVSLFSINLKATHESLFICDCIADMSPCSNEILSQPLR